MLLEYFFSHCDVDRVCFSALVVHVYGVGRDSGVVIVLSDVCWRGTCPLEGWATESTRRCLSNQF